MAKKTIKESTLIDDASLNIREPRVYELGYILVPSIVETELDVAIDGIRKIVTDHGGLPISEGRAELRDLAYPITVDVKNERSTYAQGYFGWIKFDCTPSEISAMNESLQMHPALVRFLLIKTVREVSIPRKYGSRPERSESSETPKEIVQPLDEAAVDRQIDEMVHEETSGE